MIFSWFKETLVPTASANAESLLNLKEEKLMYGMGYGGYGMGGACCPAPVAPVAPVAGVGVGVGIIAIAILILIALGVIF